MSNAQSTAKQYTNIDYNLKKHSYRIAKISFGGSLFSGTLWFRFEETNFVRFVKEA